MPITISTRSATITTNAEIMNPWIIGLIPAFFISLNDVLTPIAAYAQTIMNLLASKIRFDQTGINRLSNAISQAMNAYITNGYLNTDYIWTGDDLYYSYNGQDYLICSRNTPLVKGYKCVILPLDSLTAAQREAHALPPVYMLFADQTGARAVVVNGDIY